MLTLQSDVRVHLAEFQVWEEVCKQIYFNYVVRSYSGNYNWWTATAHRTLVGNAEEHEESLSVFCLDDLEPLCELWAAKTSQSCHAYICIYIHICIYKVICLWFSHITIRLGVSFLMEPPKQKAWNLPPYSSTESNKASCWRIGYRAAGSDSLLSSRTLQQGRWLPIRGPECRFPT